MELNTLDHNKPIESTGLAKKDVDKNTHQYVRSYAVMLLVQLAIISMLSVLAILKDFVTAYSVLIGGIVYIVPTAWFILRTWLKKSPEDPHKFLASVYLGKAGMLILTIILFTVVFAKVEPLNALAFLTTFIFLQISGWYLQVKLNNRFLKL